MTATMETERVLDAFLAPEHDRLADRVLDAALADIARTPQRRTLRLPWRFPLMSPIVRFAVAAVILVAVVGTGGALYLSRSGDIGVGGAPLSTPSLTPTVAPSPSEVAPGVTGFTPSGGPSLDTASWVPYTSSQYGTGQNPFTIAHPVGWTVTPATRKWSFATDTEPGLPTSAGADHFTSPDGTVRVSVWTVPLGKDAGIGSWMDVETWAQAFCQKTKDTPCTGIPQRAVPMCIEHRDCHPAVIVPFQDDVQAFGVGGILPEGMVVVSVWRPETDLSVAAYGGSQRLLQAFLSTMGVFPPSGPDNHP